MSTELNFEDLELPPPVENITTSGFQTEYTHTLTVLCPESLMADAQVLAQAVGYGPEEAKTFQATNFQSEFGACVLVNFPVTSGFLGTIDALLPRPDWDVQESLDMNVVHNLQATLIKFMTEEEVAEHIFDNTKFLLGIDITSEIFIATFGLIRISNGENL